MSYRLKWLNEKLKILKFYLYQMHKTNHEFREESKKENMNI